MDERQIIIFWASAGFTSVLKPINRSIGDALGNDGASVVELELGELLVKFSRFGQLQEELAERVISGAWTVP